MSTRLDFRSWEPEIGFDPAESSCFSQTTFSVWVFFSMPLSKKGVPYWKFAFSDPLGTAKKKLVVVIVVEVVVTLPSNFYYTNFF